MAFELVNPAGLYDPSANGYSHVADIAPGGRVVLVSGQGGEDAAGVLAAGFRPQVGQALRNVRTALAAVGADVGDVAKLTVLVVDHTQERLAEWGTELDLVWGERPRPACTLIPVPRLALDGMLIEVEATAVLPA